ILERFLEPNDQSYFGTSTNLYYLSFYPSHPMTQTGTASAPTNYWLSVNMQGGGADKFAWSSSLTNYNATAVYGFRSGGTFPQTWSQLLDDWDRPMGFSFKITTLTNNPPPPSTNNCCPDTGGVKYVQNPDLVNGFDVDATFAPVDPITLEQFVLADDF